MIVRRLRLFALIFVLLLMVGCGEKQVEESGVSAETPSPTLPASTPTPTPIIAEVENTNWWDDAVFYEVFVRSFADSDGDGVGDINGLIDKLDYLNDGDPTTSDDLGVTGIWLMPIMQSPSYHGYDVVDYYQVDDEYGTNADFQRLMEEAHARGIEVIVDLILNHTSDQHPWFEASRAGDAEKRDWYVWSDIRAGDRWHETSGGFNYYGYFWGGMPDLNYENPEVTAEMQAVIRFWLEEMGVDGFRLDAIKHLIENGPQIENTDATHSWLAEEFYPFYKAIDDQALTVGEAWSTTDDIVQYVDEEVDLVFEFSLADATLESALTGRKVYIERAQQNVDDLFPPGKYATFLANHDQERARTRLLNDEQAKVAATLQLMSPGVPFIYYGEEIGMQGKKPDEFIRRPMQWEAEGGFSDGTPWLPYFEDFETRHVAAQSTDADSLLTHYRELIALRASHSALSSGDWLMVPTDQKSLYAFLRMDGSESILVVVNLGHKPVDEYVLTLETATLSGDGQTSLLFGDGDLTSPELNAQGGFDSYKPFEQLPPHSTYIIQLR